MKNYLNQIKQLPGEGNIWILALRKRRGKLLFEGDVDDFVLIPNSFLYWRADPFLFDFNGETFLFAELFNRITGKGKIGVAKIKNGKCGRFKECISEPYHLSYPCVFKQKDGIYMVPESGRSGSIVIYKCEKFPYKWKQVHHVEACPAVDTTPVPEELLEGEFFLTTVNTPDRKKNSSLWLIDMKTKQKHLLEDHNLELRSAGHILMKNGLFLRPVQNCKNDYGADIIFKRIDFLDTDKIIEHEVNRVFPSEVKSGGQGLFVRLQSNGSYEFSGIHTYNVSEQYEVIDLAYPAGKNLSYLAHKVYKHFKYT